MQIFGFWGRVNPLSHGLRRASSPERGAFGGGGKVSGSAIRRPLGGAGERSEPEGVRSQASVLALSVKPYRACQLSQRESLWRNRKLCG